jgi:hypothetical protein
MSLPVYLEIGRTRIFAVVPDWPGWSRSGRTEAAALQSLIDYAPRYAHVLAHTPLEFQPPASVSDLRVVDRLPGNATTRFRRARPCPARRHRPADAAELTRMRILLDACWRDFGRAMQAAQGRVLRTGPRGGGRSLERIIAHTRESELVYLSPLGGKLQPAQVTKSCAGRSWIRWSLPCAARSLPLARAAANVGRRVTSCAA